MCLQTQATISSGKGFLRQAQTAMQCTVPMSGAILHLPATFCITFHCTT